LITISGAPSCGIAYDHHSDDYRGVIYNCNIFYIAGHRCIQNTMSIRVVAGPKGQAPKGKLATSTCNQTKKLNKPE
jgi:hypothetical protein